jgi:SAM-dependent methyltransferase
MIDRLELEPADQILFLSIPDLAAVISAARRAPRGLVVALGGADAVAEARKAARDELNVMFHPAPAEEIPFRDGFFTKIIDLECRWAVPRIAAREIARVLAPGGRVYLANPGAARSLLVAAGLREIGGEADLFVLSR